MKSTMNLPKLDRLLLCLIPVIVVLAVIGGFVLPARGDCIYEGQTYRTGDRVGPYVCMPDGTWQPQ